MIYSYPLMFFFAALCFLLLAASIWIGLRSALKATDQAAGDLSLGVLKICHQIVTEDPSRSNKEIADMIQYLIDSTTKHHKKVKDVSRRNSSTS